MPVVTSCITSSLIPYTPSTNEPWNEIRIRHAFRRIGYDANNSMVADALSMTPENFIDQLIDESLNTSNWPEPPWAHFTNDDYENLGVDFNEQTQANYGEVISEVINQMQTVGLKGRLIMFWSNHFVTRIQDYYNSNYLYEYYSVLENHFLGNFEDFVRDIGTTSAMLVYLNGYQNTSASPNENYARELYELFTLGVDNGYTQQDIVETSKALTGYNHRENWTYPIYFDDSTFDNTDKTIFNQTGNWGHDDVIDILFQEKAPLIANHICEKIYRYFVSPTINTDVVNDMANLFVQDFNIVNLLRTLFKSQHFFDNKTIGILIKSPYDMLMSYVEIARSNNSNDPYVVTKSIIDSFMPVELFTISDYQDATDIFKHNLPENYYEEGFWNLQYDSAPYQVLLLIRHLIKLPEFQLK